jgi:hypothetical protein
MEIKSSYIHQGPWDNATRAVPVFAFMEKYIAKVESGDLSTSFEEWYAIDALFHDTDGTIYDGGEAIWNFMKRQFGVFSSMKNRIEKETAIPATERDGQWVTLETVMIAQIRDSLDEPVVARRLLSFLVDKSQNSKGTDGLQIYGLKIWWDRSVLAQKLSKR